MSLRKSLFTITLINSTTALVLSVVSFLGCMELSSIVAPQGIILDVHSTPITMTKLPEPTTTAIKLAEIISILQIVLPILIYTLALLFTALMFYRLKLKEPLEMLIEGSSRIVNNDLDFTLETKSPDEMGQLCTAFETMRKGLLENNREMWRQMEERKRVNAAFSHNLRNPVTVLKGSAKLAKQGILNGTAGAEQLTEHLSLIENYTDRIERYIEGMSSIQKLEEILLDRKSADWDKILLELEKMVYFFNLDSDKQIQFEAGSYSCPILIDKSVLLQIAENLVSNALRFAKQNVSVSCLIKDNVFKLTVTDDGAGFPDIMLKSGIRPFQKGSDDSVHFGMGLYTSKILSEKHGGSITIHNGPPNTIVSAELKIN